ncbi:Imm58 family immunity protein [Verminephrobacter aporrectodeae]|uniref:Imm58 family immunity protein n=1 Tax=Verminephrobacter aporrectodeae TaxID=1110389 RepID=UPI0011104365|nr:hypothetical protein [Verminephrobacter aporrectodeae]
MNPMNRWRAASFLLGIFCIALISSIIDQRLTLSYADNNIAIQREKLMISLLKNEWLGLSKKQVMSRLNKYTSLQPNLIISKPDSNINSVCLEYVCFEFENEKLINIL